MRSAAAAAAAAKSLQSWPTLCNPIDGSPPGFAIPGILLARTLEWVAISFSKSWKWNMKVKLLSHVWLSNPMDCSPPGSSIHGIFQARVLEWGAIAFSVRLPRPPLSPGVCSNSCPLSWWCYLTNSSSATLFCFCLQSFPASGSFPISWLFVSGAKVLEFQLQYQSFQWILRVDFL